MVAPRDRQPRVALYRHAILLSEDKQHRVRVRNLSVGGARVDLARDAAIGSRVALNFNRLGDLSGEVRWVGDGCVGIAFDTPIDPSEVMKRGGD